MQQSVPIRYKQATLAATYRIDLIVEDRIVVELKSVDRLLSAHDAQLLTLPATDQLAAWLVDQLQRGEADGRVW